MLIRCLGDITGSRYLTARIGIAHIALSGRLGITVSLGITVPLGISIALGITVSLRITRLPGISLLPLGIALLRIRILVCTLIRNSRRLASCIPCLLISALSIAHSRLAARHLWGLIYTLRRLITGLPWLENLLRLLIALLRRLLIALLHGITLKSSSPGIAAGRIALLRTVPLSLKIIVIVLIHVFFPFCRIVTSGNPMARIIIGTR